jgi:hypothetical protein
LTAFENLKRYQRLYTIDEVSGPAGGGAGAVNQEVDPDLQAIQVTGRIYYGLDHTYLTDKDLIKVFESSVIKPGARRMQAEIEARGQEFLARPDLPAPEPDSTTTETNDAAQSSGESETDDDPAGDIASAGVATGIASEEG